jgi:hypothetical protein
MASARLMEPRLLQLTINAIAVIWVVAVGVWMWTRLG